MQNFFFFKWTQRCFVMATTLSLLSSCGPTNPASRYSSRPIVSAPENIQESFVLKSQFTDKNLTLHKNLVGINKAALEKEFLFQGSFIGQAKVPMFSGIKSRVVAFRRRGDKIHMLEATAGHTVTHDLPQTLLLASFPIVSEKEDQLYFDFNSGMAQIFTNDEWRAQDSSGGHYGAEFKASPVQNSFIDDAHLTSDNELVIRMIAQVYFKGQTAQAQLQTVAVKYYLKPYRVNPNFRPVASTSFDKLGFFEVAPYLNTDGSVIVNASKFDENKTIKFAYSNNTPAEYRQAVIDGILYWNKVFGKEFIQVEAAPANVTAPDIKHNVVQWVDWDDAGFAYADAQMDPRTGEITNAQVFFTSAFAVGGKEKIRRLLRSQDALKNQAKTLSSLSLKGFQRQRLCDRKFHQKHTLDLENLLTTAENDQQILRVASDYIREVVAHEVGHTLGLRHNFAGSLASNVTLDWRQDIFNDYIKNDKLPQDLITSSSVMEYQLFAEGTVTGAQMRLGDTVLPYDKLAIDALYRPDFTMPDRGPLYCTDSHTAVKRFHDCLRFDAGTSFVEYAQWSAQTQLDQLPLALVEYILRQAYPDQASAKKPLTAIDLDANAHATKIFHDFYNFVRAFTTEGRLLKIQRSHPFVGKLNAEAVRTEELDYLQAEIERLGGLAKIFPEFQQDKIQSLGKDFNKWIDQYQSGLLPNGKNYQLSDHQVAIIKEKGQVFFRQLPNALAMTQLKLLAGELSATELKAVKSQLRNAASTLEKHESSDALASFLKLQAENYLLSMKDHSIVRDITLYIKKDPSTTIKKPVTVTLYSPKWPQNIRNKAAGLLKGWKSSDMTWAYKEKYLMAQAFNTHLSQSLAGGNLTQLKPHELSRDVLQWFLEHKALKGSGSF